MLQKRNSLRVEKEAVRLNAKKHPSSRNSDPEDIDWHISSKPRNCPVPRIILKQDKILLHSEMKAC